MNDDEKAYQTPYVPTGCEAYQRQLVMARFAMHRVRMSIYGNRVLAGQLTHEQGVEEYRLAMENYDQILRLADEEPGRMKACMDDMERGFHILAD